MPEEFDELPDEIDDFEVGRGAEDEYEALGDPEPEKEEDDFDIEE